MRAFLCLLLAVLLAGCSSRGDPVMVSPSGDYTAWLSINGDSLGGDIWVVQIAAEDDEVELLEFMNDHPASLMAYLEWDCDERLWFYSSDDGSYFYWEKADSGWNVSSWSILQSSPLYPPETLAQGNERN